MSSLSRRSFFTRTALATGAAAAAPLLSHAQNATPTISGAPAPPPPPEVTRNDDLEFKFRQLADGVLPGPQADRLLKLAWGLETMPDVGELARAATVRGALG